MIARSAPTRLRAVVAKETRMPARHSISTHVLDTETGLPAPGVTVRLFTRTNGTTTSLTEQVTDADGRIADLLQGGLLTPGDYRIEFDIAGYRKARHGEQAFFTALTLDLSITNTSRHYHIPLLLAPFSCTTYRGS
jgi:5-hydroxyisourate hydrolase